MGHKIVDGEAGKLEENWNSHMKVKHLKSEGIIVNNGNETSSVIDCKLS